MLVKIAGARPSTLKHMLGLLLKHKRSYSTIPKATIKKDSTKITVGCDFAGLCTVYIAVKRVTDMLGPHVQSESTFACDNARCCMKFALHAHQPLRFDKNISARRDTEPSYTINLNNKHTTTPPTTIITTNETPCKQLFESCGVCPREEAICTNGITTVCLHKEKHNSKMPWRELLNILCAWPYINFVWVHFVCRGT